MHASRRLLDAALLHSASSIRRSAPARDMRRMFPTAARCEPAQRERPTGSLGRDRRSPRFPRPNLTLSSPHQDSLICANALVTGPTEFSNHASSASNSMTRASSRRRFSLLAALATKRSTDWGSPNDARSDCDDIGTGKRSRDVPRWVHPWQTDISYDTEGLVRSSIIA